MRRYSELILLPTFEERLEYLKLDGHVGRETFGFDRYLNQNFYKSYEWKRIRRDVIIRDNGCDLGIDGMEILGNIMVHHMNPIDSKDIINFTEYLMNPEYLITTCHKTHNAIHYSEESLSRYMPAKRFPNDTCPWKQ